VSWSQGEIQHTSRAEIVNHPPMLSVSCAPTVPLARLLPLFQCGIPGLAAQQYAVIRIIRNYKAISCQEVVQKTRLEKHWVNSGLKPLFFGAL
jgi:hypothetical protein